MFAGCQPSLAGTRLDPSSTLNNSETGKRKIIASRTTRAHQSTSATGHINCAASPRNSVVYGSPSAHVIIQNKSRFLAGIGRFLAGTMAV